MHFRPISLLSVNEAYSQVVAIPIPVLDSENTVSPSPTQDMPLEASRENPCPDPTSIPSCCESDFVVLKCKGDTSASVPDVADDNEDDDSPLMTEPTDYGSISSSASPSIANSLASTPMSTTSPRVSISIVGEHDVTIPVAPSLSQDLCRIFVRGIAKDTTAADISSYFSEFGCITTVHIPREKTDYPSPNAMTSFRSIAFITYEDAESADRALSRAQHTICGKEVQVQRAEKKPVYNPYSQKRNPSLSFPACGEPTCTDPLCGAVDMSMYGGNYPATAYSGSYGYGYRNDYRRVTETLVGAAEYFTQNAVPINMFSRSRSGPPHNSFSSDEFVNRLFLRGLPLDDVNVIEVEGALKDFYSKFGVIKDIFLPRVKPSDIDVARDRHVNDALVAEMETRVGKLKGIGFIRFESSNALHAALSYNDSLPVNYIENATEHVMTPSQTTSESDVDSDGNISSPDISRAMSPVLDQSSSLESPRFQKSLERPIIHHIVSGYVLSVQRAAPKSSPRASINVPNRSVSWPNPVGPSTAQVAKYYANANNTYDMYSNSSYACPGGHYMDCGCICYGDCASYVTDAIPKTFGILLVKCPSVISTDMIRTYFGAFGKVVDVIISPTTFSTTSYRNVNPNDVYVYFENEDGQFTALVAGKLSLADSKLATEQGVTPSSSLHIINGYEIICQMTTSTSVTPSSASCLDHTSAHNGKTSELSLHGGSPGVKSSLRRRSVDNYYPRMNVPTYAEASDFVNRHSVTGYGYNNPSGGSNGSNPGYRSWNVSAGRRSLQR